MRALVQRVQRALSPDLLQPRYRGAAHPLAGHCYVASEAIYHAGAREAGYRPHSVRVGAVVHWYLAHPDGRRIDATAAQFTIKPDYSRGRGRGFLTRAPSRRARVVLQRIGRG